MVKHRWFQNSIKEMLDLLKLNIPLEVLYFPSDGLSATFSIIKTLDLDYEVFLFDCRGIKVEKDLLRTFSLGIGLFDFESRVDFLEKFFSLLKTKTKKDQRLLFIFKGINSSDMFDSHFYLEILRMIESFRSSRGGFINVIFASYDSYIKEINEFPMNTYTHTFNFYREEDLFDYYKVEAELIGLVDIKMNSQEVLNWIHRMSGGWLVLARNLLRDLSTSKMGIESLVKKEIGLDFFTNFKNVERRIRKINSLLPSIYSDTLDSLCRSEFIKVENQGFPAPRMLDAGILTSDWEIRSQIIQAFFVNSLHKNSKHCVNNRMKNMISLGGDIFVDTKSMEVVLAGKYSGDYLTKSEYRVVKILTQHRGEIVTREKIAEVLWEEDYIEKYSDWAIDKLISRLRKKLCTNRGSFPIKTLRGHGFLISK